MKYLRIIAAAAAALAVITLHGQEFSTAGFYAVPSSGRDVWSVNPAWRFHLGTAPGAEAKDYAADSAWTRVNLPDGLQLLPAEASGCVNYRGEAWYRKYLNLPDSLAGRRLTLYFEGIMGRSRVWINGREAATHYGGYLPVVIDATDLLEPGARNVIAVMTDNSNDPTYPPGKPQEALDFAYFGGIYRDCWLVATNPVHVTDPNLAGVTAGGGVLVAFDNVSAKSADMKVQAHIANESGKRFDGTVRYELKTKDGNTAASDRRPLHIAKGKAVTAGTTIKIDNPSLWSPEHPELYNLIVTVTDRDGNTVDALRQRVGAKSVEFRGADGFWLNGEPYPTPLIGANRHQDFATVGNAVSNSAHWRDALKLRRAGMKVIRNAHCPQDPAFMDACDELGLLVIDNTPGWQFWNDDPVFAERVYSDIRQLVRRDRNHASIWLWEPILNETWYPADFAKRAKATVEEEYPYPSCWSASDAAARGAEAFDVRFAHPAGGDAHDAVKDTDPKISYFTREWGDNVDDWNSHNSPSRAARAWGEMPQLVQALHYAQPSYTYTALESLGRTSRQHVGGCLWHSMDHQRGYHPDPFYGGIMDAFRQPKLSYEMFRSQVPVGEADPMVYVAHAMTPFSPSDVTVYSNCPEVRLTFCEGGEPLTWRRDSTESRGIASPVITFRNVYDFMTDKELTRKGKGKDVWLLAEGIVDGKVVATHRVRPARRPAKLMLTADNEGRSLRADGSDFIVLVASVCDADGNVKRLSDAVVRFEAEGEGILLGSPEMLTNPVRTEWGTAPIILRSTLRPGKIKVKASVLIEGTHTPVAGEIILESIAPEDKQLYDEADVPQAAGHTVRSAGSCVTGSREATEALLKEVERQQSEFGESR